jgi:small subunit ribosomal protein S6
VKEYELTVLIHPDLEVDIESPLTKLRNLITSTGGTITKEENWGKKKMAYRIKHEDFAVYAYFDLSLPADAPLKISNALNISDEVLRYLLVVTDLKGRQALAEAKASEETDKVSDKE